MGFVRFKARCVTARCHAGCVTWCCDVHTPHESARSRALVVSNSLVSTKATRARHPHATLPLRHGNATAPLRPHATAHCLCAPMRTPRARHAPSAHARARHAASARQACTHTPCPLILGIDRGQELECVALCSSQRLRGALRALSCALRANSLNRRWRS